LEEIQKIIWARKGCWHAHKWLQIGWVDLKIQELKFNSIFFTDESPVDKKNSIWGRKVQNQMFMDLINFYLRFNWI
jgi:hypothetical protein